VPPHVAPLDSASGMPPPQGSAPEPGKMEAPEMQWPANSLASSPLSSLAESLADSLVSLPAVVLSVWVRKDWAAANGNRNHPTSLIAFLRNCVPVSRCCQSSTASVSLCVYPYHFLCPLFDFSLFQTVILIAIDPFSSSNVI